MALRNDPVLSVFREVFRDEHLELTESSTFEDVPGWDSIGHVNLIAALEEQFKVKFTIAQIAEMSSVGDVRSAVAAHSLL